MRILGWKDRVFVKRNSCLVSRTKRTVLGTLNNGWLKEIHALRHSERTMHVRGWVAIGKMFTVEKYYCRRGRNSACEWLRVSYSTNKPGNSGDSGVELKLSKMFPYLSRLLIFPRVLYWPKRQVPWKIFHICKLVAVCLLVWEKWQQNTQRSPKNSTSFNTWV